MNLKKLLRSTAKRYKKTTPELKIVYALLLILITFILRLTETFINTVQFIKLKIRKIPYVINRNKLIIKHYKRNAKHILKSHRSKKVIRKNNITFTPVKTKLKYFSIGIIFSFIFLFLPLAALIFLQDLPNPHELSLKQIPQTTKIYDRNKVLLYEIYSNENRTLVSLDDIPVSLKQATLAIEDKNFYKHPGFDLSSIFRALKENMAEGKPIQGGSTITQQLIKSSVLTSERTLTRKIKELVLAFWAERIYTKNQILEMYFNQIPYGGTAWGAEAASEVYFGKHVNQLDLAESAFLAGLTQAPSQYSPYGADPSVWKNRQKEVLERMKATGSISDKQAKNAFRKKLVFREQRTPLLAPHFVMYIKDLLINRYGIGAVEKGGLTVITSLDIKKQEMAQKIVTEEVNKSTYLNLTNGAALITNPINGDILAMVGSKDFQDPNGGNYNVTTSLRQPGSTVKVITYSAALMENLLTPATIIEDTPAVFNSGAGAPPYSPVNYDGHYFGKVTMRFALANSLNLPAVKTLQRLGVSNMVNLAQKMGINTWDTPERYGLSVTLGSAETTMTDMATVFGTLSNLGERVDINPILLITDSNGTIIEQKRDIDQTRVLPEGIAYIISDIISDNQTRSAAFGQNSPLTIAGHKVAVKTGTSDNKRDNWAIGFTKDYVVTVWVGNNDNSPMSQTLASGITGAAPIWHNIIVNLIGNTADTVTRVPADIMAKPCLGRTELFYKGTENSVFCGTTPAVKFFSAH